MLYRIFTLFVCFYFLYFSKIEVEMKEDILGKVICLVVETFRIAGIIASGIWFITSVVKELVSIPWSEWAENGVLEHIKGLAQAVILFPFCLFIMWILHASAMYMLHKLWPDTYDKYGHMKKQTKK